MKRTTQDDQFALEFGRQLQVQYQEYVHGASQGRISEEQFAANLDVSRAGLRKYLVGKAMPTLRTVVLANVKYGVNVSYFGVPLFAKRRTRSVGSPNAQLILPFSVRALGARNVSAKIESKGTNHFEIRLDVGTAV